MEKHAIETVQRVKVFFASSGELEEERKEVYSIATAVSKVFDPITLEIVKWETDIASGSYADIQAAITKKLEKCPIVVVLFYTKVGNFTLEEYELAMAQGKKVFLYFKRDYKPAQGEKYPFPEEVGAFRDKVTRENKVIFEDYKTVNEFKLLLRGDLEIHLKNEFPAAWIGQKIKTVFLSDPPPRTVELLGRDKDLSEVGRLLKNSRQLLLVNGLGGVGKTELCRAFFRDYEKEYAFLGWVDYVGSIKETFVTRLTGIPGIGSGGQESLEQRFNRIMSYLYGLGEDSLLVIDNLDNPLDEDLSKILSLRCRVLVSSRLKIEGFLCYDLDFLTPAACTELFYRFYRGERDDVNLSKIIELAGYHTLTVELLARTAWNSASTLADFLHLLEEKGFNLNDVIPERCETMWSDNKESRRFFDHLLKVFALANLTEEEIAILTSLSLLPALYIEIKDISLWLGLDSKDPLNSLVKKGWLRQSGLRIFLHQVMAEVIYYHTRPDCDKCGKLITAMANNLYCEPGENPLKKAVFLPYADAILRFLEEDNEKLATLSNNLSTIYRDLGRLEKALEYQLKAIGIVEKELGADHPHLAASYNNVATIYRDLGRLEKALEYQLKAIGIREKVLTPDHPDLAASYNNVSMIYLDLGRLAEALEYSLKDVKISEKVLGKDHPSLATSYNNVAMIYLDLGRLAEALEYSLKDVKISEKVLGKDHPSLATSYNNVAMIYLDLGRLEKALEYQLKAIGIMEKVLNPDHPDLATSYNNVATIYRDLGRLEKALEYQLKAIGIVEKELGADHPHLAASYNNVAMIYRDLGRKKEAQDYARQAVAILEKLFPQGHPNLDTARRNLKSISL
jgi:tetratricopeptide (TPR) repeat protein